ncbi:MAG: sugar transferase [bacterium]|nr:sugar transferase [bacterium]
MLYGFVKRTTDIIGSIIGFLLLIPLTLVIGTLILIDTRGPIFIKLKRISGGKAIYAYKFRTMIANSHEWKFKHLATLNERKDGPFFKIKNDPRITRVGRWLRRIRIDEFPQLVNVLKGELTLVGPRPHEPEEINGYPAAYQHLPQARAGLTGLSQVSGASSLAFTKELELDDYYLTHKSFLFDIKILLKTLIIFFTDPTAV